MKRVVSGKENFLPVYVYKDYGSLVNLGKYSTVGNLMGSLLGGTMFIEGLLTLFNVFNALPDAFNCFAWFF